MKKSSFLKVVPFIVTMALGIYVSGLFAPSSGEISVGHSESSGHHCNKLAEGMKCDHMEKGGPELLDENKELQKRIIELEQRLDAIENGGQLQPAMPVAPVNDVETPIS